MTSNGKPRVVVLGGGFAGLESAFLLRSKLGDRVDIALVSDRDDFLFKPNTIYIPFGGSVDSLLIPLDPPAGKRQIRRVSGSFESLDKERRVVRVEGQELQYDYLVLATGAGMRPEEVPGLAERRRTVSRRHVSSSGRSASDCPAAGPAATPGRG